MKDRIKALKRIPVSKLKPHPQNHRLHPDNQQTAMKAILDEVGWADALIVREHNNEFQILDGHLRKELAIKRVPCLVVDLNDDEANLLLATHDHITNMAEPDQHKLDELLNDLSTNNPDVQQLLDSLSSKTTTLLDEGKEYDESCADDVLMIECPNCGHQFVE